MEKPDPSAPFALHPAVVSEVFDRLDPSVLSVPFGFMVRLPSIQTSREKRPTAIIRNKRRWAMTMKLP
jgi:hypothetical protein